MLTQMMSGAVSVLKEAGCLLVGGHTSEGAELALGFSINGIAVEADLMRKVKREKTFSKVGTYSCLNEPPMRVVLMALYLNHARVGCKREISLF